MLLSSHTFLHSYTNVADLLAMLLAALGELTFGKKVLQLPCPAPEEGKNS